MKRTKSPIRKSKSRSKTPKSKNKVAKKLKYGPGQNNPSLTMKSYEKVNYEEIFGECRVLGTLDGEYKEEDTPGFNLS